MAGKFKPFTGLAILFGIITVVLVGAFMGMCASIAPVGDTGGKGEIFALVMAALTGFGTWYFWKNRHGKMS